MTHPIRVGDRVKLVGSRCFTDQIKEVVGIRKGAYGDIVGIDVDCGHPDGKPYAYPPNDVELVTEEES